VASNLFSPRFSKFRPHFHAGRCAAVGSAKGTNSMAVDLYAGVYVRDCARAVAWYTKLLGEPAFVASDTEVVWEFAEHRYLAIEEQAEHAGHSVVTVFVDDFDERLTQIASRGLQPTTRQRYGNGVRKALFHDPDGNEIGLGSAPAAGIEAS